MIYASQKKYPMVAGSPGGSDKQASSKNIIQGHAFTFLSATYLNFNGSQVKIVKLRNPWGEGENNNGEWKGEWSDNDPNWKKVSSSEKARVGYVEYNSNK